ncbi:hypothetical protein A9Q81_27380 [Gammaproteobacteria bacterium 42_54_T18]|nr:hypothetical protein A9Q81_27380 [Gammaproteobacteria bacterium 42_54_T18]
MGIKKIGYVVGFSAGLYFASMAFNKISNDVNQIAEFDGVDPSFFVVGQKSNEVIKQGDEKPIVEEVSSPTIPVNNSELSLQGTDIPAGLITGSDGNLIVTTQLKRLFDYYFTLLGRKNDAEIIQMLESYISAELEEPARSQALDVLSRHLSLSVALESLPTMGLGDIEDINGLQAFLTARALLRREHLGEEVAGIFYQSEQLYDEYTVSRLAVMQSDLLTETEKTDAFSALLDALPNEFSVPSRRRQAVLTLRALADSAESQEMTPGQLFAARESLIGGDAASRMQRLDNQRERWGLRYQVYLDEADQIKASDLSQLDQRQSIEALRRRHFENDELRRVGSLDSIRETNKT